jgi:hypothetical protein
MGVLAVATIAWIALITWILTAGGGFVMLAIFLARGGMRQGGTGGRRIPPALLLGHFLLAAAGLVVWIVYDITDTDSLAWVAFVILLVVALGGFAMFAIWLQQRQRRPVAQTPAGPDQPSTAGPGPEPAEQHFPVSIVGLHGVLAATTLVLVLLTALGVGGS